MRREGCDQGKEDKKGEKEWNKWNPKYQEKNRTGKWLLLGGKKTHQNHLLMIIVVDEPWVREGYTQKMHHKKGDPFVQKRMKKE